MEAHKPIEACFLIQHPDSLVKRESDSLACRVKQKLLLMIEYNLICKYAVFITNKDLSLTNKQSYTSLDDLAERLKSLKNSISFVSSHKINTEWLRANRSQYTS